MDVDELIATLKHGLPLCSHEVDGAIELVERLKADNAELRDLHDELQGVISEGRADNYQQEKEINRLKAENEELQLTNREYFTELEDEKRKVGLLRIENEELKKRLEISEGAFGSKSRLLALAQDEITRLQSENARLYRVAYIARTIYNVTGNKQPCPHGNAAHYPTHAWWCDDCWEELRDALTEVEFDE